MQIVPRRTVTLERDFATQFRVTIPVFVGEPKYMPYYTIYHIFPLGGFRTINFLNSNVQLIYCSFHQLSHDVTSFLMSSWRHFGERDRHHVEKHFGCLEITLIQMKSRFKILSTFLVFYFPCNMHIKDSGKHFWPTVFRCHEFSPTFAQAQSRVPQENI